jgi:hypothetical protein
MIAGLLIGQPQVQQPALIAIEQLDWLAGHWEEMVDEGPHSWSWTVETWTPPRGGVMLGTNLSGKGFQHAMTLDMGSTADSYEFMRIAYGEDGAVYFYASPGGAPASAFKLVRADAGEAVFENAAHDYPQRVAYRRDGDTLTGTISLIDGSRTRSWRFRRR